MRAVHHNDAQRVQLAADAVGGRPVLRGASFGALHQQGLDLVLQAVGGRALEPLAGGFLQEAQQGAGGDQVVAGRRDGGLVALADGRAKVIAEREQG